MRRGQRGSGLERFDRLTHSSARPVRVPAPAPMSMSRQNKQFLRHRGRKVKANGTRKKSKCSTVPNSSPRTSRRPRPRYHPRICDRPPARPTVEGGSIQHHCDCPQSTMSAYAEALGNTYLDRHGTFTWRSVVFSMPGSPAPLQSPVDGAGDRDPAVCATESI